MRQLNELLEEIKIKDDFEKVKIIVPLEELYRIVFGGIHELDIAEEKKGIFIAQCDIQKLTFNTNKLEFKAVSFAPEVFAPEDENMEEWERNVDREELLELLRKWKFNF